MVPASPTPTIHPAGGEGGDAARGSGRDGLPCEAVRRGEEGPAIPSGHEALTIALGKTRAASGWRFGHAPRGTSLLRGLMPEVDGMRG